jgi:hypothetical protein
MIDDLIKDSVKRSRAVPDDDDNFMHETIKQYIFEMIR